MQNEIHPAPTEFTDAQISTDPILHFFHYAHLPATLQATSRWFANLAWNMVTNLPRNAERTVALRKLLEAKDAAVRANLPAPTFKETVASERCSHDRIFVKDDALIGECLLCHQFISATGYVQSAAAAPGFLTRSKRDFNTNQPTGEPVEIGGHDEDRDGPIPFDT